MTPEATLLLAWLDEADAPQWVVDGVADALPKIEGRFAAMEAAARRYVVARDADHDFATFADADDCYDPSTERKLEAEVDGALDALRAALGIPDMAGMGGGPAPHGGEGSIRIWLERKRQSAEEGYDDEHDDALGLTDLVDAAVAYICAFRDPLSQDTTTDWTDWWPWSPEAFKPSDLVRNLVKAGALIAAAIDSTLRALADLIPDPGLAMEDAIETASDGGEL